MAHLIGQRMGSYRLTRLLGRGGFAEVYLGEHLYIPRTRAAIKVLSQQYTDAELQRFCHEVSTIFRLAHPLIVRVQDFGVEGRTPFLVMDYAPNGTLRDLHPEGTQLPLSTILPYVKQAAEALHYAHEAKVIHRDIKPENLLIGEHQRILLSDFGIAVSAHRSISQTPQKISGTALYMAPEQCQGKACQASDQYSLAVVVYEWLSGSPPFPGDDPISIALQHIQTSPPPLRAQVPTLLPAVEKVVLKALAKDPKKRFPSVLAFAAALEEAHSTTLRGVSLGPTPSSPLTPTDRLIPLSLLISSPDNHQAALPPPDALLPSASAASTTDGRSSDLDQPDALSSDLPALHSALPDLRVIAAQVPLPSKPRDQRANAPWHWREPAALEKGSLRYFIGGGVMVLFGLAALLQSNGHPSAITWTVAGFAIILGCLICLGAFLDG